MSSVFASPDICAKEVHCYLGTKSALTFLRGADSIIHDGSDSLLLCSWYLQVVATNRFNCHSTIAYINMFFRLFGAY